ncbi:MAG: transposase [Rhizonema sp. PD37]|nr:transposase [Rhizonema sp. PD37]
MDLESTSKKLKKTLTYRVYPKGETKKVWMQRIHAYRKVYNNAIAYLNKYQCFEYLNKEGKKTGGKTAFRSFCKTLGEEIIPTWCKELKIAHALDNALFEAYLAWIKTKRQDKFIGKGNDRKPNPFAGLKIAKFKSVRDSKQTIQFDPGNYDDGHFMSVGSLGLEKPEYWGQDYCLINFDDAAELTYNKGRWYVNFPIDFEPEARSGEQKIIALDPGLRCFLTGFDGQNFKEFANGDFARIAKLCQHLDKLKSKHDQAKGSRFNRFRHKLKEAMERVRIRIKNLRDEVHKQVGSYLARHYDTIYLPTFETSQMVAKKKRKLKSKSARAMMTWAFYEFSQNLQHLCNRYGSRLVRVTEEYTSKTCTLCGKVHYKLGGNKKFKCPHCGYEIKRDFNGALGIFLKALWDTTFIQSVSENDVVFRLSEDILRCPRLSGLKVSVNRTVIS